MRDISKLAHSASISAYRSLWMMRGEVRCCFSQEGEILILFGDQLAQPCKLCPFSCGKRHLSLFRSSYIRRLSSRIHLASVSFARERSLATSATLLSESITLWAASILNSSLNLLLVTPILTSLLPTA